MAGNWMKAAFGAHPGKFTAKAKAVGKSTQEFAAEKKHAGGTLGKEAALAARAKYGFGARGR
jgi:hypothetical protein